jgi:hypothetical protein
MSRCPFSAARSAGPMPTYDGPGPAGAGPTRRGVLQAGVALAAGGLVALDGVGPLARLAHAAPAALPDVQYAIGPYLAPAVRKTEAGAPAGGTLFGFGPTYTLFVSARLTRTPTQADRLVLEKALATLESTFAFSASGLFTHVSYGLPYFRRLPGGLEGSLVASRMPRLLSDTSRPVLEEAVPGPTDVHASNPSITKPRFHVPVRIEDNDVLLTLRSDSKATLEDVQNWLWGSGTLKRRRLASPAFRGLLTWTSSRLMFAGPGLPRQVADSNALPYARYVHPESPMWMGFADMVADAFGPPGICTFQGNASARLTTETGKGYFANSSVQVLNHVILDLTEWYLSNGTDRTPDSPDMSYLERAQYMYRPHDPPSFGWDDQYTDGGGPTWVPNVYQGSDDARRGCAYGSYQPSGDPSAPGLNSAHAVLGHTSALQRTSRTPDGTPLHIRVDGPGFDAMDVPDGSSQPKLHFSALVPTSDLFRRMRISQASLDLAREFGVELGDQGLETRITATRRQNFLMPRRRNRAFPLLELSGLR